ncbi:histidine phosphatase family protein [Mycetocola lacteus]|uniref:Histidine phosphatase family protein n=1 Tax=Mycetocola lacteus TaxID=76637 RepID=A0A3L7AIY8_9MICO|nr:histidine phosphatase family protein [Mycetocola lacteus]RLP79402.1 histidine phosphatase family protein [Mycetocola lacteus]
MTTFILVRHGETIWHTGHRYAGMSDIPLDAEGQRAADALAEWAVGAQLDAIVVSPLIRAVNTARPSAIALGMPLHIDPDLVEVDFGVGEGKTISELRPDYPDEVAAFEAAPADSPLPGGEVGRHAITRYLGVLDKLRERYPAGRVLVVGHGTAIRLAVSELIGIEPNRYRDLMPEMLNCGRTTLEITDRGVALQGFNVPSYTPGSSS